MYLCNWLIRVNREKKADVEAEPNAEQWREFDEANIESDIIRQRQEDINQIGKIIFNKKIMNEINQMTNDMAVEMANADSKLDQIGANARTTKENTKKALVDIAKGSEYQNKFYKRVC